MLVNDPGVSIGGGPTGETPAADVVAAIAAAGGEAVANTDSVATAEGGRAIVEAALGRQAPSRAARLFRPIAGLGVALTAVYLLAIQPRLRRWGATRDEVSRRLPGDEFVPEPAIDSTWAVTIDAPVDEVWPWLAQIGQAGLFVLTSLRFAVQLRQRDHRQLEIAGQLLQASSSAVSLALIDRKSLRYNLLSADGSR